nr:MAG TPA: ParE toxin of type II toxin-antitoxin system, parDE [Caudoviricetes sp.]
MSSYGVKISPQAYEELDGIYKYIATNLSNPTAAINLVNEIETAILSLDEMPYMGATRKVGIYANAGYRQLFVENYTIVYRIDEGKKLVIIVTARYTPSVL